MLATVSGQAHNLRPSLLLNQSGYVLRQLWMQAAELGEDRLAGDLRGRLRRQPDSDLIPIWTMRRTSRALWAELGRHDDWVTAVAVLPDGRVVSGGEDGWVLVWDPARPGTDPVELGRHDDWVQVVAVLPDGRVVSGGDDRRVLVWDPSQPGTDPVELGRHDGWVQVVAVLGDGRVVSGGNDSRVVIWNAITEGMVAELGCSVTGLAAVQASRGEASLFVAHEGPGFSLWSIARDDNEPC
jgi:WD40 repeat protein